MWRKLGFDVAMGNELTLKSSVLFGTKNGGALTHVSSLWVSFFPILAVQHVDQHRRGETRRRRQVERPVRRLSASVRASTEFISLVSGKMSD
jgi:hypothetical protein